MATISELANVKTKDIFPYQTSNQDWLKAVVFMTERLNKAYEPGEPKVTNLRFNNVKGLELVYPGWRISKRTYTDLTIRITAANIAFIEQEDEDDEVYPFDIWNSSMFPSILDVYDYITSLIISHTRKY